MIRAPRSDFWQVGIVRAPITAFLDPEVQPGQVLWLPDPGPWRYLADPFGVRRGQATHLFVEAFDYRTKHGVIEHHELGPDLEWRDKRTVLAGPHHLSYPYLIEHAGETFMVPECHRAGEVALYRARDFPGGWVRETALLSGVPASEASFLRHEDRWWMFFTVVGPKARDQRELHVAYADELTGPWHLHAANPILNDRSGARPGGTPFISRDGAVILPVQDCSKTYGGAIRLLWFTRLTPETIATQKLGVRLTGESFSTTHQEGCHTLSACGDLTLVDTKRIRRSWSRHLVNLRRTLRRRSVRTPLA
jgi:hypothetical protein